MINEPQTIQGDLANLPTALASLKTLNHWVCWKWEWRLNKAGNGKWTKPPLRPQAPAQYAKNNDPSTWGTYTEALATYQAGLCNGIGFAFPGSNVAAFDLDNCRDPATGAIAQEAATIVQRSASYTEVTPSGTGLRVIGTSNTGAKVHRKQKIPGSPVEVESYIDAERYITITGLPMPHTPAVLNDIGGLIGRVVQELEHREENSTKRNDASNSEWRQPFEEWRKAHPERPWISDMDVWIELHGKRHESEEDFKTDDSQLPPWLMKVLRNEPPAKDLSAAFHGAVNSLFELGWSARRIELYIASAPVVPERYEDRLKQEIYRCLFNAERERAHQKAKAAKKEQPQAAAGPLDWLDMSNWDTVPVPERKWAIVDRVPLRQVGLFSGEGGTGKSIIELMKDVAHVAGKEWLGSLPEQGPVFYLGAEDDVDELHIRLSHIARHYGVTFKELVEGGLHVLPLLGKDAVLCAAEGKSGRVEITALYKQIYEAAGDLKPINISVDTLTRAFAGNEIDRVQVYGFAMHMQALAMAAEGSVTILSHPSLTGVSSGTGLSGSTAWHGAFRFRMYLKGSKPDDGEQPDDDLREFEFKKNQYGPRGQSMVLRYGGGLFLPDGGNTPMEKLAREAKADQVFMELLARFADQGRNVSEKKTANNYAPTAFAKEAAAREYRLRAKPDLEPAMMRMFAGGRIRVEHYGRSSRPQSRLVAIRK